MEQVGVRALRANLAAAVRQAGAGQRLVITLDGRPVAQLAPLEPSGTPSLADLAAAGLLEPPHRFDHPSAPPAIDPAVDVRLDRILNEVRGQ